VSGADGIATAGVASAGATPFLAFADVDFPLRDARDFRVSSGVTSDVLSSFGSAGAECVAPFPVYEDLGSFAGSAAEGVSALSPTSLFG